MLVEVLADEDEFLHAVAELVIPITTKARVLGHELLEFVFRHRGVPLTSVADADLFASLFKDVAGILFVVEVADAFGTDDALGPFAGYELVEESEVERTTAIVDVGSDAVFFSFALIVVMMVMMVMMLVTMMVLVLMMMLVLIVVVILVVMLLHFLNPSSRSSYSVEVEHVGIQYLIEFYVAIVAVDDFGLGLEGADDLPDASQFLRADLSGLVQQHDVAEFNLLDDEVFDILFVDVLARQIQSAAKLVPHAEGIDDGHDAVE